MKVGSNNPKNLCTINNMQDQGGQGAQWGCRVRSLLYSRHAELAKKAAVGLGVVMPVSNLITVQRLLVAGH